MFIPGIRCPACGSTRSSVTNSRQVGQTIRRTRKCRACKETYQTRELPEDTLADLDGLDELMTDPAQRLRRYPKSEED